MIKFEPGEHIVLEVRKHWFVFFVHTVVHVFFALVPLIAYGILRAFLDFDIPENIWWLLVAGYFLWVLGVWVSYFIQWTDFYLDVWYITNEKIYDVLQEGFFDRHISILRFDKIQDVTVRIQGIIPTLLDFGEVHVQTAGQTSVDFTLKDARHPNKVKHIISDLLEEARKKNYQDLSNTK